MNAETQGTISEWAEQTFGEINARGALLRCADEFAELAKALGMDFLADRITWAVRIERQLYGDWGTPSPNEDRARAECADVLITLYRVIERLGGDLHAEVDDKMVINRARKWKIVGPGIGQHVKAEPFLTRCPGGCDE